MFDLSIVFVWKSLATLILHDNDYCTKMQLTY